MADSLILRRPQQLYQQELNRLSRPQTFVAIPNAIPVELNITG